MVAELNIKSVKQRIPHTMITQPPEDNDDTGFSANTNYSCLL